MAFPRKILVPLKSEPKLVESAEVPEILNWISPTQSYWTAMSNEAFLKKRTLKQLLNSPDMGLRLFDPPFLNLFDSIPFCVANLLR